MLDAARAGRRGQAVQERRVNTPGSHGVMNARHRRERLSQIGPDRVFVCADFKGADGTLYDCDFWVEGTGADLAVVETTLHKVAGQPLYNWVEKEGVWSRQSLDGKALDGKDAAEHPEHPEHPAEHPEHPK